MKPITNTVHNFNSAESFLKGKSERKIGHNTTVVRISDTSIGIKLHSTVVVEYHNNETATLRTGGWQSVITKDRLNTFSGGAWRVWAEKGEWHVSNGGEAFDFEDGVIVGTN